MESEVFWLGVRDKSQKSKVKSRRSGFQIIDVRLNFKTKESNGVQIRFASDGNDDDSFIDLGRR